MTLTATGQAWSIKDRLCEIYMTGGSVDESGPEQREFWLSTTICLANRLTSRLAPEGVTMSLDYDGWTALRCLSPRRGATTPISRPSILQ